MTRRLATSPVKRAPRRCLGSHCLFLLPEDTFSVALRTEPFRRCAAKETTAVEALCRLAGLLGAGLALTVFHLCPLYSDSSQIQKYSARNGWVCVCSCDNLCPGMIFVATCACLHRVLCGYPPFFSLRLETVVTNRKNAPMAFVGLFDGVPCLHPTREMMTIWRTRHYTLSTWWCVTTLSTGY